MTDHDTDVALPNVVEWWSLPGEPLYSGFDNWHPATRMRAEAEARVLAKVNSVARARALAHAASIMAVIG